MTTIELLLYEMGFVQETDFEQTGPNNKTLIRRENFPERAEVVTLIGQSGINVSCYHESDGETWYHKESRASIHQTAEGLPVRDRAPLSPCPPCQGVRCGNATQSTLCVVIYRNIPPQGGQPEVSGTPTPPPSSTKGKPWPSSSASARPAGRR